jgi:peroxiredoxin Q/BCP
MKLKDFRLEGTNKTEFQLSKCNSKFLVIYFYPKDATPGCTNESIAFNNHYSQFKKLGCEIFGISRDTISSHEKFKTKYDFKFELLSDNEEIACSIFDVIKMKNMYGKQVRGIERSTFVFNAKQEIIKEWRGVKVDGHVEEVLQFIQSIK